MNINARTKVWGPAQTQTSRSKPALHGERIGPGRGVKSGHLGDRTGTGELRCSSGWALWHGCRAPGGSCSPSTFRGQLRGSCSMQILPCSKLPCPFSRSCPRLAIFSFRPPSFPLLSICGVPSLDCCQRMVQFLSSHSLGFSVFSTLTAALRMLSCTQLFLPVLS